MVEAMTSDGCSGRTVVMRATIEYVRLVPSDQSPAQIEEYTNDLNECGNNTIERLHDILEQMGRRYTDHDAEDYDSLPGSPCFCSHVHETFVREATDHDESMFGIRACEAKA